MNEMVVLKDACLVLSCHVSTSWYMAPGEKTSGAHPGFGQAPIRSTQPTPRLRPPTSLLPTRPSSHYTASHHRLFPPTASLPSRNHPSPLPSSTLPSPSPSHLVAGARIVGLVHCLRPLHGTSRATRFFERASARQPTAQSSATPSHPGTPPSPAPAYTSTKAQQCAFPSGQMRSNRAPHDVLQ